MLIAMAGLPATGKSALAAGLAAALGAVVLSKDAVRPALFPPPALDYSREQDDVCMTAIYHAAAYVRRTPPRHSVILDGRTFLRSYQVRDLLALYASLHEPPCIIECVCADEVARARLEGDARAGHPAGNRTFALYLALKAEAEPLPVPRLVLDTGRTPLVECVRQCLVYVSGAGMGDIAGI
jgi:adenylylsulfate kinase